MIRIHPLTLREELLHSFEVRDTRGHWRQVDQRTRYSLLTKRVYRRGKYIRKQAFQKQAKFRKVELKTDFKFDRVRLDRDDKLIFKLNRWVRNFQLKRLLTWEPFEKINPVLRYLNTVRMWASSQGLSVGGFPLSPYEVVVKSNSLVSKAFLNELVEGITAGFPEDEDKELDEELVPTYAQFVGAFLREFGLGQVWQGDPDSDEIKIYVAYWAQTAWREYRNELPRFFVRSMTVSRDDLGEKGEERVEFYKTVRGKQRSKRIKGLGVSLGELGIEETSKEGRELILRYVFNNAQTSEGEERELNLAPLGIVGWGYAD